MKAGVYLRVSTERQDAANQMPDLRALCAARGWEVRVFTETESGAKARPLLDELCDNACRGKFGAVVVWALDRLGRTAQEIVDRVRRLLVAKVRVVSHCEPWMEQDGPQRELLLFVFAWVAEQERRRLVERTRAGLAKARARGKTLGRPRADSPELAAAVAAVLRAGPQEQGFRGGPCRWKGHNPRSVKTIARKHGVGEGTLRRAVAAARAKNGAEIGEPGSEGNPGPRSHAP